jgi:hypothetical protein
VLNVNGSEATELAVNVVHRDDGVHLLHTGLNSADVKTCGLRNLLGAATT